MIYVKCISPYFCKWCKNGALANQKQDHPDRYRTIKQFDMGMVLASIQKRKSKNGKVRFRVFIRHKGHPPITGTFSTKTEAKQWAQKTEVALQ